MSTLNLKAKITNGVLALSLLFGLGVALSTEAQAQYRNDDYYRRQREYERQQRQRQRELERQQRRAERQARRNGGYYGNNGYYGNRTYDGYGNYGGTFDLRQTALNAGYNNGMEEGRRDRERNERFNFQDESDYRSATKDYSSRLATAPPTSSTSAKPSRTATATATTATTATTRTTNGWLAIDQQRRARDSTSRARLCWSNMAPCLLSDICSVVSAVKYAGKATAGVRMPARAVR